MVTNLYSVLDVPAEQFSPPFPARNNAIAGRVMDEMLKNVPEHLKCEYRLYKVGIWDDNNGNIVPEFVDCEIRKLRVNDLTET